MKAPTPKLKNSFTNHNQPHPPTSSEQPFMKDSLKVTTEQLSSLVQLYRRNEFENGFNSVLAFRVIVLWAERKGKDQQQQNGKDKQKEENKQKGKGEESQQQEQQQESKNMSRSNRQPSMKFSIPTQVTRFLTRTLTHPTTLPNIQQCMDLLLVPSIRACLPSHLYTLSKIRVLSSLSNHYHTLHSPIQRKKSTHCLRQLCLSSLQQQLIKHDPSMYCQILDTLLLAQSRQFQIRLRKRKRFQALQLLNNMVTYLQGKEEVLKTPKYQGMLMQCYWQCALLHYELHYVAYTKKYCQIVVSMGQRVEGVEEVVRSAKGLMEKVGM